MLSARFFVFYLYRLICGKFVFISPFQPLGLKCGIRAFR